MKIRMHCGQLFESMNTVTETDPSLDAVRDYLRSNNVFDFAGGPSEMGRIDVVPYGFDNRIDWDVHAVKLDGVIYAFTDGPLLDVRG